MKRKVGVVLSGCGYLDGSEIHEAVLTLLALDELGVDAVCMAPRGAHQVVDHVSKQAVAGARRDVLQESARIARGRIADLATVDARSLDAVVLPGGYGAAKNLCDFADKGAAAAVQADVARLLGDMHAAHKPIGAFCIAPAVVAALLGRTAKPLLTIGDDEATAEQLRAAGARHQSCAVDDCVVDREQRVVSTPAYMFDARPTQVAAGIRKACAAVVAMIDAPAQGAP